MTEWVLNDLGTHMLLRASFPTIWDATEALCNAGFTPSPSNVDYFYFYDEGGSVIASADTKPWLTDEIMVSIIAHVLRKPDHLNGNLLRWVMRQTSSDTWFEGYAQTLSDAHEMLELSEFNRVEHNEGHYKREWPSGVLALGDLHSDEGIYRISVRYYDHQGKLVRGLIESLRAAHGLA